MKIIQSFKDEKSLPTYFFLCMHNPRCVLHILEKVFKKIKIYIFSRVGRMQ